MFSVTANWEDISFKVWSYIVNFLFIFFKYAFLYFNLSEAGDDLWRLIEFVLGRFPIPDKSDVVILLFVFFNLYIARNEEDLSRCLFFLGAFIQLILFNNL